MIPFETKKHGTLYLRNTPVDELLKLAIDSSVVQALQNLCQRGEVMKNGELLLNY